MNEPNLLWQSRSPGPWGLCPLPDDEDGNLCFGGMLLKNMERIMAGHTVRLVFTGSGGGP